MTRLRERIGRTSVDIAVTEIKELIPDWLDKK